MTRNGFTYSQYVDARVLAGLLLVFKSRGFSPRNFSDLGRLALTALYEANVPENMRPQTTEEAIEIMTSFGMKTIQLEPKRQTLLNTQIRQEEAIFGDTTQQSAFSKALAMMNSLTPGQLAQAKLLSKEIEQDLTELPSETAFDAHE